MTDLTRKHWRSMVNQSNQMLEVFSAPPIVAYRRQRNIRESWIRAKVAPENNRNKRFVRGMQKCGKGLACSYIKEGNVVK